MSKAIKLQMRICVVEVFSLNWERDTFLSLPNASVRGIVKLHQAHIKIRQEEKSK